MSNLTILSEAAVAPERIEELKATVRRGIIALVDSVKETATALYELHAAGVDLSEFHLGTLLPILLRIGCEQARPELFHQYLEERGRMKQLALLPLADQDRFIRGEGQIVVVINPQTGSRDRKKLTPAEMTPEQFRRVFSNGRIRSEAEQGAILDEESKAARRPIASKVGPFSDLDEVTRTARFDGKHGDRVSLADAEALVRLLRKRQAS